MKNELIIVRYGEIALKSKETRRYFENCLINNMRKALDIKQVKYKINKEWGRIYVYTNQINESVNVLKKIFGIISISPAVKTQSNMDSMSCLAVSVSKDKINNEKTFAIRVTRAGNHNYSSQDVAVRIGTDIIKSIKIGVDLTNPDFELFIEVRNEKAYFFTEKINGTGGLPLGTQGKILAFVDTFESILAAWYLMRRGCCVVFLNINKSNIDILNSFMTDWFAESDVVTIESSDVSLYDAISKLSSEMNCDAVVTGNSFYKNFQNELCDIKSMKKNLNLPIFFPLIAMEEEDIYKKCKEIGLPT